MGRETSEMSERLNSTEREAKAQRRTACVHICEESDHVRVARNPVNKDSPPSAERGEGTTWTRENAPPFHTYPTRREIGVPQGSARVRQAARKPSVPYNAMHPR